MSASSGKGRLYFSANFFWSLMASMLMPMTVAPISSKAKMLSRNSQASLVHPWVSAFG